MKEAAPSRIFLKDYTPPVFLIRTVDLCFQIFEKATVVHSKIHFYRNIKEGDSLFLDGECLKLLEIKIDGEKLSSDQYEQTDDGLVLKSLVDDFIFECSVEIDPVNNKALEGLYKSGNIYCTQNEAQGFRKITYYLDRPDVLAKFKTRIEADKNQFPLLLSNGNRISEGELDKERHWVQWEDPFPKPCYLFALVAGDLAVVSDDFITKSGRKVRLEFYVDHGNEDKCDWAIRSLKESMKWDERRFSLEYDLDLYMVVAVDAFNMGAMENKGLNIFNSHYVLAKKETATDDDFIGIESVIGHEYFHNWTGNRVTCRDWFQLTLKEGLTVYRDQEFTSDLNSRVVKRIDDVKSLRARQFPEDAGPMSHPIRPSSYIEINNFYTATVYEKGAEVIRMMATIIGEHNFRKAMNLYFQKHDGQAVTTEDFVNTVSEASSVDFDLFKNWYQQKGTPIVKVVESYNQKQERFEIDIEQALPFNQNEILHIPLKIGLLNREGEEVESKLIELKSKSEKLVFSGYKEKPVLSFNREFSAPIKVERDLSTEEMALMMAHDTDGFNRWDCGQRLYMDKLKSMVSHPEEKAGHLLMNAFKNLLVDTEIDNAFKAYAISLPSEAEINDALEAPDYKKVHEARIKLLEEFALSNQELFYEMYINLSKEKKFSLSQQDMGNRALKNKILTYLYRTSKYSHLVYEQFNKATNMTDELGALRLIVHDVTADSKESIQRFYDKWQDDFLVLNKWFAVCASADRSDIFKVVNDLAKNPKFDGKNPNMLRSLYGSFAMNLVAFNKEDGSGYEFMAKKIEEIDSFNPQIAARFCSLFNRYHQLPTKLKGLMKKSLEGILEKENLSRDTFEIVSQTLKE